MLRHSDYWSESVIYNNWYGEVRVGGGGWVETKEQGINRAWLRNQDNRRVIITRWKVDKTPELGKCGERWDNITTILLLPRRHGSHKLVFVVLFNLHVIIVVQCWAKIVLYLMKKENFDKYVHYYT